MKKVIYKFVIFFIILISQISFSQSAWNWYLSYPTTNNYTCVKFIDKNTGFITGECGTLLRTTNGGTNWIFIENNINYLYTGICPINTSIVYSLTKNTHSPEYGSNLYKSTNAGINWMMKKHFANILKTIYFIDENSGYTAGDGILIYTSDGGTSWINKNFPSLLGLQSIFFINSMTGFAVSGNTSGYWSTGQFIKTTDGGQNWTAYYLNDYTFYSSVYFKDANIGLVCGGSIKYYPPPPYPPHTTYQEKVFKTTNGGLNWDSTLFGTSGIFRTMSTFNDHVFVYGEASSKYSTDYGTTWINLGYTINPTPRSSCLIDSTSGFVVGDNGRISKITNGWLSANQNQTFSNLPISSIYFTSVNTGYILTYDPYSTQGSHIYKTTNAGFNWNEVYYESFPLFKEMKFNGSCGAVVGNKYLLLTSNGGINWNYLFRPGSINLNQVCVSSNPKAFAVGDSGLVMQSENFSTWVSYQILNVGNFIDITFPDANTGYILNNSNILLKSTNSGNNWTPCNLPFNNVKCMFFLNANTGFISIFGSKIFKTTSGGTYWDSIYNSGGYKSFSKFYFLDTIKGFAFNDLSNILEYTTNGGSNWNYILLHYPFLPNCINFINQNTGFLGGIYGTIFRTTNGGTIWINNHEKNLPKSFSLSQNYPNPFNPTTTISFKVKSYQVIRLVVYDILGKEVAVLVNEKLQPGEYETTFDGSGLASGVYFYSLFADGERVDTKKMVLLK